jgi:hypothetical protein
MPVDKRKITHTSQHPTWMPTISLSLNAFYLLLIFISLAWNVYNTHQYQILTERQLKLETILAEVLPSSSLSSFSSIQPASSFDRWVNKVVDFLKQLTSYDGPSNNNSSNRILAQPNPVSSVFLEMPSGSLDTCARVYLSMCGSRQGRTRVFQTCITN